MQRGETSIPSYIRTISVIPRTVTFPICLCVLSCTYVYSHFIALQCSPERGPTKKGKRGPAEGETTGPLGKRAMLVKMACAAQSHCCKCGTLGGSQ